MDPRHCLRETENHLLQLLLPIALPPKKINYLNDREGPLRRSSRWWLSMNPMRIEGMGQVDATWRFWIKLLGNGKKAWRRFLAVVVSSYSEALGSSYSEALGSNVLTKPLDATRKEAAAMCGQQNFGGPPT
jgi:hypothetical protein